MGDHKPSRCDTGNRLTILGAGAWGQALAVVAARAGMHVMLWQRTAMSCDGPHGQENHSTLVGAGAVMRTHVLEQALAFCPDWLWAVPAQALRHVAHQVYDEKSAGGLCVRTCVNAAKGLDQRSGQLGSEILQNVFGDHVGIGVVAGPNLAQQVLDGYPCGLTVASPCQQVRQRMQRWFDAACTGLIVQSCADGRGVEMAGALKNFFAMGYGLVQGLWASTNMDATYGACALQEMRSWMVSKGGDENTLHTFAGVADFWVSCQGGRNSRYGRAWAQQAVRRQDNSMKTVGNESTGTRLHHEGIGGEMIQGAGRNDGVKDFSGGQAACPCGVWGDKGALDCVKQPGPEKSSMQNVVDGTYVGVKVASACVDGMADSRVGGVGPHGIELGHHAGQTHLPLQTEVKSMLVEGMGTARALAGWVKVWDDAGAIPWQVVGYGQKEISEPLSLSSLSNGCQAQAWDRSGKAPLGMICDEKRGGSDDKRGVGCGHKEPLVEKTGISQSHSSWALTRALLDIFLHESSNPEQWRDQVWQACRQTVLEYS